ncbi:MAG: endonuclease/exonuclease/phosphatase family protein [Bacteroidales bacterium]
MKAVYIRCFLVMVLLNICVAFAQNNEHNFRVMFYNVENFFDIKNDSLKQDDEFTPGGVKKWNYYRFRKKYQLISKVIAGVGEDHLPALIGMCEVENDSTLIYLTQYSALKHLGYRFLITDSPDERGIDVALLYQRDQFKVLDKKELNVSGYKSHKPTRNILYVKGLTLTLDSLHVFVVHLPSRSSGKKQSDAYRLHVIRRLISEINCLKESEPDPRILVMGDFNAGADDFIVQELTKMTDMKLMKHDQIKIGSYKYKGEWETIDHIFVSASLAEGSGYMSVKTDKSRIYAPDYLLKADEVYGGMKIFRTYSGYRYEGGFSDHLPVFLDIELKVE